MPTWITPKLYTLPWNLLKFDFNAEPDQDPAFHSNADPASRNNVDPDPQTCSGVHCSGLFFLLFLLGDRRIRIRISDQWVWIQEAQKPMDPWDPYPEHCFKQGIFSYLPNTQTEKFPIKPQP